jgi:hypothetical protein
VEALLACVPVEALDWVYMVLQRKDWSALRAVIQPGMSTTEANAALLSVTREAKRREAVEVAEETPSPLPTGDDPGRRKP